MTIKDHPFQCAKGDYLRFPSGRVRKVITVTVGKYMQFIQIADGVIGNYRTNQIPRWMRKTRADGKRITTYTWSDLRQIWRRSEAKTQAD